MDATEGSGAVEPVNAAEPGTPPGYSHAVVASEERLVVTSVPLDPEGNLVGHEDYVAQTRQILDNLALVLAAADVKMDDVLKTTVYVVTRTGRIWPPSGRRPKNPGWPPQRARCSTA